MKNNAKIVRAAIPAFVLLTLIGAVPEKEMAPEGPERSENSAGAKSAGLLSEKRGTEVAARSLRASSVPFVVPRAFRNREARVGGNESARLPNWTMTAMHELPLEEVMRSFDHRVGDRIGFGRGGVPVVATIAGMDTGEAGEAREIVLEVEGVENGVLHFIKKPEQPWAGTMMRADSDRILVYEEVKTDRGALLVAEEASIRSRIPVCASLANVSSAPEVDESEPRVGESSTTGYVLQSLPGASRVIYLDFDGETVANTAWNSRFTEGQPIEAVSPGFSDSRIEDIWSDVAEDFRPFNVNVTTDRSVYEAAPFYRRVKCVVTTSYSWYPSSAGGVGFVTGFGSGFYGTCWVFSNRVSGDANRAVAISHEIGHTVGLRHDATSSRSYYAGHGSGQTGWGPIMGAPYGKQLTQWDDGSYPDADNQEDDLAIIRRDLPVRADDHSDVETAATALPVAEDGTVSGRGIIGTPSDVDCFGFWAASGRVVFEVELPSSGNNLDVEMKLLDAEGVVIGVDSPGSRTDASLSMDLPAGQYYVKLDGVGKTGSNGYSGYGSLGSYTLAGVLPPGSAASAFEAWRLRHFDAADLAEASLEATVWGDHADADGDGLPNLLEFFGGTHPLVRDAGAELPTVERDGGYLTLAYYRSKNAIGVSGRVVRTRDLRNWDAGGIFEAVIEDLGDRERVEASYPISGSTRTFLRLEVSR